MAGLACDQGRNYLDLADGHFMKKKTTDVISSLDFALSQLVDEPQRADEFSVDEFFAEAKKKDKTVTSCIVRNRLQNMQQNGLLSKRRIRRNGTMINLYRKA
jgi:hypothetical protein